MKEQNDGELSRRQFIQRAAIVAVALPVLPLGFAALRNSNAMLVSTSRPVPAQDWAGVGYAPLHLSWKTKMVVDSEPGEPLLISGTIFQPDGATPAKDITLYVYHTDTRGYYSNEAASGQPPKPRLRGWMRTKEDGRYEFRTIKPGAYPGRTDPAHIHVTLAGAGYPEYWIDSYWFEGDPRITAQQRAKLSGRGGFQPIIALKRDEQGVLTGARNIRLEHV